MTTLEEVLETASSAGYSLLAEASNGRGYVLGRQNAEQPVGVFQTLDEVMNFLATQYWER
ncbi:hypothetical protein NDI52_26135 [Leptolyngbya sp. PL-A3]|uniref:hypothetical protein n=1 Tax=Leptolyngbya sp. PL-A3 TaxID=2933911 RepID=UPI003297A6BE